MNLQTIFNFFKKSKPKEELPYRTVMNTLTDDLEYIALPLVKTDKPIFLIMDDYEVAADITYNDIEKLDNIAKALRSKDFDKHSNFINSLDTKQLTKLSNFKLDDFEVIICSSNMAAFKVMKLLEVGRVIEKAFLDIIIGGNNLYKGHLVILDGIDVAKAILDINPNADILFYSGCSLDESGAEFNKCKKLLGKDINSMTIGKNNNKLEKIKRLLELLG